MIYAAFLIGLSAFLSLFFQPYVQRFARTIGAIDKPSTRKLHRGEIPRSGGMAIVLSASVTIVCGWLLSDWLGFMWGEIVEEPVWVILAFSIILILGIWDDCRALSAMPK